MKIGKILALIIAIGIIIFVFINNQKGHRLTTYNEEASNYLKEERYQEAIDSYQKIIDEDPKISGAYIGIAAAYGLQHNYSQAKEYCLEAINVDPALENTNVFSFCEKIINTK